MFKTNCNPSSAIPVFLGYDQKVLSFTTVCSCYCAFVVPFETRGDAR